MSYRYIPRGGIFKSKKGKVYEAVTSDYQCKSCAFLGKMKCYNVSCCSTERADKTDVVFLRRKDLEATKPETTKENSDV